MATILHSPGSFQYVQLERFLCWLHAEVFWVCTNHALTTEAEEIMGLLLGDVIVRLQAPLSGT